MLRSTDKRKIFFYLIIFSLVSSITSDYFFKLKISTPIEFNVNGLEINENNQIKNELKNLKKKNILGSKTDIYELINSNELVEEFEARIIYPNKIYIEIKETSLLAKTFIDDKLYILGSNKKLIDKYSPEYKYLPTIFGKFNKTNFIDLLSELKKNKFEIDQIDSFYFFPSKRWDIKLKKGLLIKLPEKNWKNSIKNVLNILNDSELNSFDVIDLRVKNRAFLK